MLFFTPQRRRVLFLVIIVPGVFYVLYRSVLAGGPAHDFFARKQRERAAHAQTAAAETAQPQRNEEQLRALLTDKGVVERGKGVFLARCAVCHGQNAEGGLGPNLTDAYWLHGGTLLDIKRVIEDGALSKGMPAWRGVLRGDDIDAMTVFVKSVGGSNPPKAKAPQGNLME